MIAVLCITFILVLFWNHPLIHENVVLYLQLGFLLKFVILNDMYRAQGTDTKSGGYRDNTPMHLACQKGHLRRMQCSYIITFLIKHIENEQ